MLDMTIKMIYYYYVRGNAQLFVLHTKKELRSFSFFLPIFQRVAYNIICLWNAQFFCRLIQGAHDIVLRSSLIVLTNKFYTYNGVWICWYKAYSLVVTLSILLLILLLTGSNNLQNSALICYIPSFQSKQQNSRNTPQNRAFPGKKE